MRIRRPGFTLIELMLVIGIVSVLAGMVILAINPSVQLSKTNNTQRAENIRTIMDAFSQYAIDHNGDFQNTATPPPADCLIPLAPATARKICASAATPVTCDFGVAADGNGCVLADGLMPKYLIGIPTDPKDATGGNENLQTDYTAVVSNAGKRITIVAPNTEIPPESAVLSVSR